uniref:Uncharacterized protein n=1 Tax=Oryza meridionalis TaxID=40149 RepID=A0A0E0FBI7_9ORYZ
MVGAALASGRQIRHDTAMGVALASWRCGGSTSTAERRWVQRRWIRHGTVAGAVSTGDYRWEARRWRIRTPLHATRARTRRGSGTGDGGRGRDGQLQAGGMAVADPAAAPPPRALPDLRSGELGV